MHLTPILFILFFVLQFSTQAANATTLEEAVNAAKVNNRTIKFEDYKLEATKSLKTEARAAFLPNISASGQYGERKSSGYNSATNNNQYNSNQVEELKAEQPIFDGFGSVAKYNEADYKVTSATLQNQNKKQEITFDATHAYCELFRYQNVVVIQKNSEEFADQISDLTEKRKRKKVVDVSEAIKFKYEISSVKIRYLEAENKLLKAKFEYRNVVGEIPNLLEEPSIKKEKFDEKTTIEKALTNNNNLKSYRFNYLASKSAYSAEKATFSPSVSLVGSVSRQKNALYLNGQDFQNRSVYLNVSVPIFQKGVEYSNLTKAGNQISAAREELEVTKDAMIKNIGQSIQEYNFYLKLNQSNQELLELAQDRAEILTKRFNAGAEDVVELLRAKIELNNHKIDLINSQMDLVIAYHKIKFFLGEI